MPIAGVYTIVTAMKCVMDKNENIVTNIVIQALKMDDTIKRQEIMIERLQSDKNELLDIISKMKEVLLKYAPESVKQLELFSI
jgi:hypothetical protein